MICKRCSQDKEPATTDKHLCVDCARAESTRVTYYRQHQEDWLAEAIEQGIDPWLQQPRETQWEYTVWSKYRDSYPGKKPTYRSVAEALNTTYGVVKKIAQRWTFPARMQAWIVECDRITMIQRRDEIIDMNKEHIDMAGVLRDKLRAAIDMIEPSELKPGEINSLVKLSNEMERTARLDTLTQDEARQPLVAGTANPNLKKGGTKQDDLEEIVAILTKAGAFDGVKQLGIRQTTEVAIVDKEDGN